MQVLAQSEQKQKLFEATKGEVSLLDETSNDAIVLGSAVPVRDTIGLDDLNGLLVSLFGSKWPMWFQSHPPSINSESEPSNSAAVFVLYGGSVEWGGKLQSVSALSTSTSFLPKYRLAHPENYSLSLSEEIFSGSKYPKCTLFNFEKWSTAQHCRSGDLYLVYVSKAGSVPTLQWTLKIDWLCSLDGSRRWM